MQKANKLVDYDVDRYNNRIRKFRIVRFDKVHGRRYPVWEQDLSFTPETGFKNLNKVERV